MVALPIYQISLTASKPKSSAYPPHLNTLGDHLRSSRLDRGLEQSEIAHNLGVHCLSIVNWELNHHEPELRFVPRIIEFLGYNPLPYPATFGAELIQFRTLRGWTQKEFAREIGVDPTTLARWERNARLPWGEGLTCVKKILSDQSLPVCSEPQ